MDFINEKLEGYCQKHTQAESDVLYRLNRETNLKVMSPRMLSGHLQGSFLSLLSKMIKPSCILEIGTYTGYSALCLAQGLQPGGRLITIDVNEETEMIARRYFKEAGMEDKIVFKLGDAKKIIPSLNEIFDCVFIDADKKNYAIYYDLIIDKVPSGGIIIADNVLWSGKVITDEQAMDPDTRAIHEFNKKVHSDERVENLLLPLRDGLMILRKN